MTKREDTKKQELIDRALSDLNFFIKLIHPDRILGTVHEELNNWCTRQDAKTHQLILLPRDHQKSSMAAYRAVWEITKNPAIRILYISATSKLAKQQLKLIKDILTCKNYNFFFPEMVHDDDMKREKWTETEISVDHPTRKKEYVRDPTVFTAGLTTTITGLHCDIIIQDDVVIEDNAYNAEGREKARTQASYLSSIAGTDGRLWAYGTRYHPKDLYHDYLNQVVTIYNEDDGSVRDSYNLFEVFERQVEDRGDGTGNYLWPRQTTKNGKSFGFNQTILAQKKAQYFDNSKFRSQYYNDPSDSDSAPIKVEHFQYYNKDKVEYKNGSWTYRGNRLNVFAAIDFAYSTGVRSDYTAIVVVGVDPHKNYYILDIERFKTDNIKVYFDKLLQLHQKWSFRKLRAEVTAAQSIIVKDLKENYIKKYDLGISIDESRPTKRKEERIDAALTPRYQNLQIYHYKGGNCSLLEEELIQSKPAHDDIKDCLSSVLEICVAPIYRPVDNQILTSSNYHPRFGGTVSAIIAMPLLQFFF